MNYSDWTSFGNGSGYFRQVQNKTPHIEIVSRDKSLPVPIGYKSQVSFVREEVISRKWGSFDISYTQWSYKVFI